MTLHPESEAFLEHLRQANPPAWESLSPAEAREAFASLEEAFGSKEDVDRIENRNAGDVPMRLYGPRPSDGSPQPVVIFFHGGGFVLGDLETHDALCRRLAAWSGCNVISVDYPLSPESKGRQTLDDCWRAIGHIHRHAADLCVDVTRMAVAGDSAGGHLAAMMALRCRDEKPAIPLKLQLLIYPVIEPFFQTESYREFADGYGLTLENMKYFWRQFSAEDDAVSGDDSPSTLTPTAATTLTGVAPAHIVTAEYDVLRDEGETYASSLHEAGVPVVHRRYDGRLHGFVHFAGALPSGIDAARDLADVLKAHLQPSGSSAG